MFGIVFCAEKQSMHALFFKVGICIRGRRLQEAESSHAIETDCDSSNWAQPFVTHLNYVRLLADSCGNATTFQALVGAKTVSCRLHDTQALIQCLTASNPRPSVGDDLVSQRVRSQGEHTQKVLRVTCSHVSRSICG